MAYTVTGYQSPAHSLIPVLSLCFSFSAVSHNDLALGGLVGRRGGGGGGARRKRKKKEVAIVLSAILPKPHYIYLQFLIWTCEQFKYMDTRQDMNIMRIVPTVQFVASIKHPL